MYVQNQLAQYQSDVKWMSNNHGQKKTTRRITKHIAEENQALPPYYDLIYRTVDEFVPVCKSLC